MRTAWLKAIFGLPLLVATAVGCNATTVRSGLPPADAAPHYDKHWHSSLLFGTIAVSGPYDLDRLCPDGWSEVAVGPDPFTVLASAMTLFIYSPARVTVVCAARGAPGPPPIEGYAPTIAGEAKQAYPPAPPPPASF